MKPVSPLQFGMYHPIGLVRGGLPNTDLISGAFAVRDVLNRKFPYCPPDSFKTYAERVKESGRPGPKPGTSWTTVSPDNIKKMRRTASTFHPLGKALRNDLKKIDLDYCVDAFAIPIHDTHLPGNPIGIATGQDARFLYRLDELIRKKTNLFPDEYHGRPEDPYLQALKLVESEYTRDLTAPDSVKRGRTIEVTLDRATNHVLELLG